MNDGVLVENDERFFNGVLNACVPGLLERWAAIGVSVIFWSPVNTLYNELFIDSRPSFVCDDIIRSYICCGVFTFIDSVVSLKES